ncbi:M23 family metallopeptidase [Mongoliitalea daihaiensis]|uniref:M23 family metallopeptidase n=1 Tax=Mongoliitalea daihaiensis TaxID=2782006 RepID=UPI001F3FF77A|nr:M23 family metallopeptidase [Mongoliitalea daihaiensis]UJP66284.1 M23 family metallopeptidase [Mongoliitalea daihaiensis]
MKRFDIKKLIRLKYLFVIRKEQDFSVLSSFSLSASRLLVLAGFVFLLIFGLSILSTKTIFKRWFDASSTQMANTEQILKLSDQLDSLLLEVKKKEQFVENIQLVISGDLIETDQESTSIDPQASKSEVILNQRWSEGAQKIIGEFQSTSTETLTAVRTGSETSAIGAVFFFSPIKGFVSAPFDPTIDHFGVDVISKENEPVLAIADGTVILSTWTIQTGYVIGIQHRGEFLSFYKHNSVLLKEVGDVVRGGDIISIVGNTGDLSSGAHLHFEIWHKGLAINPQEFITFD